uniref:Uncharacterized protein n=1 Tax=viral metagenome TaxID=1070528 RepID=A0A6C0BG00_9ZZZZ
MTGDLNIIIQVIFGLVVIILLYVITLVVLNVDSIVASKSVTVRPRDMTLVIDGYAPSSQMANKSYNTINPFVEDFRKIGRSINTHGGAQFTYQLWMKIEDITIANFENQVLLLKGDNRKYNIGLYDITSGKLIDDTFKNDYAIKSPLIKFGSSYKDIIVEFNTNKTLNYSTHIKTNTDGDPISKRNALSLLPINWYLFTFVFEDNFSQTDSSENGIKFTFYMNDFPYHSVSASSDPILRNNFLKQNEGNLHILPGMKTVNDFIKLANIKYYNYAVDHASVMSEYSKGPPKHAATLVAQNVAKPAYLSAYNKMDIYNY